MGRSRTKLIEENSTLLKEEEKHILDIKNDYQKREFVPLLPKPQFINPRFYQKVADDTPEISEKDRVESIMHSPLFPKRTKKVQIDKLRCEVKEQKSEDRTVIDWPKADKTFTFLNSESSNTGFFTFGKLAKKPASQKN